MSSVDLDDFDSDFTGDKDVLELAEDEDHAAENAVLRTENTAQAATIATMAAKIAAFSNVQSFRNL